jgi:hypothetical protein
MCVFALMLLLSTMGKFVKPALPASTGTTTLSYAKAVHLGWFITHNSKYAKPALRLPLS